MLNAAIGKKIRSQIAIYDYLKNVEKHTRKQKGQVEQNDNNP